MDYGKKWSKGGLARIFGEIQGFKHQKVSLEQYETPAEIAADLLWHSFMQGDIKTRNLCDLGCGTGVLGIGALILGAEKVHFVDKDPEALDILDENLSKMRKLGVLGDYQARIHNMDVGQFNENVDIVLQNPPFGIQRPHSDIRFLLHAIKISNVVYSFHKSETIPFLQKKCSAQTITHVWEYKWGVRASLKFHFKRIHYIDVSCIRMINGISYKASN